MTNEEPNDKLPKSKDEKAQLKREAYTVKFGHCSMGVEIGDGGLIQQVLPGSVAANAGVQKGDTILSIDSVPISHAFAHTKTPKAREVGAALNRAKRQNGSVVVRFRPAPE